MTRPHPGAIRVAPEPSPYARQSRAGISRGAESGKANMACLPAWPAPARSCRENSSSGLILNRGVGGGLDSAFYNCGMPYNAPRSTTRLLLAGLLALALPAALIAGKTFVKPTANSAINYPAHDFHRDEKVAIAADPYDNVGEGKDLFHQFRRTRLSADLFYRDERWRPARLDRQYAHHADYRPSIRSSRRSTPTTCTGGYRTPKPRPAQTILCRFLIR